ncbi:MAG: DUF805 domain-containing protein [Porphyrobacter sp.]|nr:DUF805 domain-containing protein [Porphyrobacter sp.]
MIESLIDPFRRMFDFRGRSRRRDYWLFVAWQFPIFILALILGLNIVPEGDGFDAILGAPMVHMAVFGLPTLALQVRRLHDSDKGGWWLVVSLLPYLGLGWLILLMAQQGTWEPNRFGPDPRQAGWEGDLFE